MNIAIRSASLPDASILSDLGARTFRDTYAAFNDPADMDRHISENLSADHFRAALADPKHLIFLLFVGEEAAGFTQLVASTDKEEHLALEIHRIYLLKNYQGQGLGARLIRHCIATARENGYRSLWLGVWKENPRAIAFYEKMGFRITGEHIFQLGNDPQEDWVMSREVRE